MRQVIGWIALVVVAIVVAVLMAVWGLRNNGILEFTANVGNLVIGVFIAGLVGWFLAPILWNEEGQDDTH